MLPAQLANLRGFVCKNKNALKGAGSMLCPTKYAAKSWSVNFRTPPQSMQHFLANFCKSRNKRGNLCIPLHIESTSTMYHRVLYQYVWSNNNFIFFFNYSWLSAWQGYAELQHCSVFVSRISAFHNLFESTTLPILSEWHFVNFNALICNSEVRTDCALHAYIYV